MSLDSDSDVEQPTNTFKDQVKLVLPIFIFLKYQSKQLIIKNTFLMNII